MASLEERVRQSQRRGSAVEIMENPLSKGATSSSRKIETVVDTRPINKMEVINLIEKYIGFDDDNKRILEELEVDKQPYTFECDDLLILMGCTTSVRTKLAMVTAIAPRLIDPKSKMDLIVNSFRFAEEKETAEDAIKARIQVLTGSLFKKNLMNNARGGRGSAPLTAAGRGSGGSAKIRTNYASSGLNSTGSLERQKDSDDEEDEDEDDNRSYSPGAISGKATTVSSIFANVDTPTDDYDVAEEETADDAIVAVDEIYGQQKSAAETAASIPPSNYEEEYYEDGDSDDDQPPPKPSTTEPPKPQESIASSVFRAFSYGFGSKS